MSPGPNARTRLVAALLVAFAALAAAAASGRAQAKPGPLLMTLAASVVPLQPATEPAPTPAPTLAPAPAPTPGTTATATLGPTATPIPGTTATPTPETIVTPNPGPTATAAPGSSATPAPAPTATPTPAASESAPGAASTPPGAAASPSPPAITPGRGLVLERSRIAIVPGTTLAVGVAGGNGTIVARASDQSVDVRYDALARKLFITGRAPGTATVTVTDDAGNAANLAALVAPPAGVVPSEVTVELGGIVSPQFAAAKIEAAIAAGAQLRPGTRAVVRDVTPGDTLRPGQSLEALGRVHLDGADTYADADGTTSVHLKVDSLAQLDPDVLFYSDDPERLEDDDDGVLFRGSIDPDKPVRTYLYHVAGDSPHKLFLVFSATAGDAQVQIIGASAGPSDAFGYVGHISTLNYFLVRGAQESSVVTVGADQPYVLQVARELQPGELVAGIFDARVLSGGPVELAVVATSGDADPLDEAADPELAGDGHGRRGEFDLTTLAPLALTYVAGAPDPAPFAVGAPSIPNLRPGGRPLGGDYGALRDVTLNVRNAGTAPATVYFYESPAGGSATTTIWFTGDPRPTEIPCVIRPNRYTIKAIDLASGEARTVTGEYMTDGTSSFPLLFGLTSTPPSPPPGPYDPDACNPRPAPVASASPAPSPASEPAATPAVPGATFATPAPRPTSGS